MRKTLLQGLNGCVFCIGPAWPFEEAQKQHTGAFFLADAETNGAQHHAESRLALAFAFTVIDMQLAAQALVAPCRRANADAASAGRRHSATWLKDCWALRSRFR